MPNVASGALRRWWWVAVPAACLAVLVAWRVARLGDSAATSKALIPPTSVVTAPAHTAEVPVYLTGIGSVTPIQTVTVHTRVDGQLMQVLFREGQLVRRGELLAVIDPRPFEAQLMQAQGQLARDRALLANAERDLQRYQELSPSDAIPQQQLATQRSLVRQYRGIVKTDEGAVDNAKLQLIYCRITSPLDGRVGLRLVDPGNIVHAADVNGLVIITQMEPITVVFTLAEDHLPEVLAGQRRERVMAVTALDRELQHELGSGTLLAVDNQIDPASGTVRLKALFPNHEQTLFPNQFVNARLLVSTLHDALVIPSLAVQWGPQGAFVYLVGSDGTVALRPVSLGAPNGKEVVVLAGLSAGEPVIVEGSERVRPGAKVKVRQARPGDLSEVSP